ncbi:MULTISPECIES: hypothetical protein [unclassified Mycobacterium]|uniref:hypothetical protein n=1 Tax=Mycobacterium sp. DL99 TaxID=2528957 RepID=UPI00108220CE|nr:hypothetical protein [Mycobacterium sp. DL99]
MSILRTLTTLSVTKPCSDADGEALAAWLDAKADLHSTIAGHGGPDAGRAHQLAEATRRRAAALRCDRGR